MGRLESYHYASREHVVFALAYHGTLRRGSIHSLDVSDVKRGEGRLKLRHRPSDGTRLKNKKRSERVINVSDGVMRVLGDWIDDQRPEVTDEEGRRPLVSTQSGRAHLNTIASDIYYVTKPLFVGDECGCEGGEYTCESSNRTDAYKCESSVSPHTVRGAAITHHLDEGWLIDMVADRADNSADVIREHYDNADEDEQAERRAEFMELLEDDDADEDDEDDEDDDEDSGVKVSV
jgi:integrase